MGDLFTIRPQYAPPSRNVHHGAQGRLYFLKNSGDPDVHMSPEYVCLSVCLSIKFGAKGGHYRSEGFVCLSVISEVCADNLAYAVNWLYKYKKNV